MNIILLERVGKIGNLGDVVSVKPGFARNYLLPRGKALRATKANIAEFEHRREDLISKNASTREGAETFGATLDGTKYVIIRAAAESGALYGSVGPRDVTEALAKEGFTIDRHMVILKKPIKDLGLHEVSIVLHPEVISTVTLNVARSEDEAEIQASGFNVKTLAASAEAEAEAELANMLKDAGAALQEAEE